MREEGPKASVTRDANIDFANTVLLADLSVAILCKCITYLLSAATYRSSLFGDH